MTSAAIRTLGGRIYETAYDECGTNPDDKTIREAGESAKALTSGETHDVEDGNSVWQHVYEPDEYDAAIEYAISIAHTDPEI